MKCLENLSMVPDRCLDDLQKDIESVINSYINLEKSCVDLLNKVKNNLTRQDIEKICKVFSDWFIMGPLPVYSIEDFTKVMGLLIDCAEDEEIAVDIAHMFGPECNVGTLNLDKEKYWFYKDEVNLDAWIVSEEYFKYEINEAITCMSEERLLKIHRILKEIEKREKL